MKRLLVVVNTNAVNRYGDLFTIGALESGLAQSWEVGVPSCLGHDYHRPVGWSKGLSLHIEPGLVRATALTFIPENEEEVEEIHKALDAALIKSIADGAKPHFAELQSKLRPHLAGDESPFLAPRAAIKGSGLAKRAFREVFGQTDKDGLVPQMLLRPRASGVFEKDGVLLFAHPFFRRSLSRLNNLNSPFFRVLQALVGRPDLDVRVALDEDMVGLARTYLEPIELDYWWGPKFSEDVGSIPPGITCHEASDAERSYHGISRTEFRWYSQGERKVFECEELRSLPSFGIAADKFGCRYVHSIVDPASGQSLHIDGAVRTYDRDSMGARLRTNIGKAGRHTDYTKMWRVEGSLEISKWKELITHYYRDNHLVGEYFGADRTALTGGPSILSSRTDEATLADYVPCNMEPEDGVRISVSYHPRHTGTNGEGYQVQVLDHLVRNGDRYDYIEADAIELIKILKRRGRAVSVPDNVFELAFEDTVTNFPLILHGGPNSVLMTEDTRIGLTDLCRAWVSRGQDRLISYSLAVQYSDRDACFSIAGHVKDLYSWLQAEESRLPADVSGVADWCESALGMISRAFRTANDVPPLSEMLQHSGVLVFKRRFLQPEEYCRVRYDPSESALVGDLVMASGDTTLYDAISSGHLDVAPALLVRGSTCSRCRRSYRECACSKYLDCGVTQIMTDTPLLALFWTNRKA